jgi:hypothetical protein
MSPTAFRITENADSSPARALSRSTPILGPAAFRAGPDPGGCPCPLSSPDPAAGWEDAREAGEAKLEGEEAGAAARLGYGLWPKADTIFEQAVAWASKLHMRGWTEISRKSN